MRAGEAAQKIREETQRRIKGLAEEGSLGGHDLSEVLPNHEWFTFDDALRTFINLTSKRDAAEMVNALSTEEVEALFSSEGSPHDAWLDQALVTTRGGATAAFSMGYAAFAPEHDAVPRTKEGFAALCRKLDKNLLDELLRQFSEDLSLQEYIAERTSEAVTFVTVLFSVEHRPRNHHTLVEFFDKLNGIIRLDCFIAGGRSRMLLEEEASFEAMMKEL